MEESVPDRDWLNFHHLRYFWAVAGEGSLRGAAEKLRVSQPSMSAQIKLLESSLGEPLFRRSGRALALTDFGQLILAYAEEIFATGRELLAASKRRPDGRSLRLNLGVVDSFPKLLSLDILRPLFTHDPRVQITCREGKLDDLLGMLGAHRLDAILADEAAPSTAPANTFSHPLGASGVTFCAAPALAGKLRGRFPRLLNDAPALLPTQNTALRRDLERWFAAAGIQPRVVAEFEDASLAQVVASDGIGFIAVPTAIAAEAMQRYGLQKLGATDECQTRLFLITAERRVENPAVLALAQQARRMVRATGRGRRR